MELAPLIIAWGTIGCFAFSGAILLSMIISYARRERKKKRDAIESYKRWKARSEEEDKDA